MSAIVDGVIAILVVEAVILAIVLRRLDRAPPFAALLPNLLAGLFLMLATRSVVAEAISFPMLGFLALGGMAHVADLVVRFRAARTPGR